MTTELTIPFLKSKIKELKTALFFAEFASLLKLPTHVITAEYVDNEAQIWFVIPRPSQCIQQFDQDVPAKLDFFKKGADFYLKIQGIATIIGDKAAAAHMTEDIQQLIEDKKAVLVRIKIQHADYFEPTPKPSQNWLQNSGTQLYNWLLNPEFDVKNPQLVTIPIRIQS